MLLVSVVLLLLQLVTPIIINLPILSLQLIMTILVLLYLNRERKKKKLPLWGILSFAFQFILLGSAILIFALITVPNEKSGDSHEFVLGVRRFLASQGLMAMPPKNEALPKSAQRVDSINPPTNVEIKIQDNENSPASGGTP